MNRFLFILLLAGISSLSATPLIKISGKHLIINKTVSGKSLRIVVFDSITNTSTIEYHNETGIRFYKYADAVTNNNPVYPQLSPDDATGYIAKQNDQPFDTIWVIDYSKYKAKLKAIEPESLQPNACSELSLKIDAEIPLISYEYPSGSKYILPRKFQLKYATMRWTESKWQNDNISQNLTLPQSTVVATAPLCDTRFRLFGDSIAEELGVYMAEIQSSIYTAVKVETHLKTVVSERKEKNEQSKPENKEPISYSVPIEVEFRSNANEPTTAYYKWDIYKDKQLLTSRTDRDHRYSFTEYGTYKIVLSAKSAGCTQKDSITINAYEAAIQVPNVFTPNGDNINDEFRVAYKSLLSFECSIYNRWGRLIYRWDNPQKGWNGKIGSKDAPVGAYFYVIKASGYGLNPKNHDPKVRSTITLSGDINLLR